MTEAAVRSTPKALARQLASLTAEVQTYAARADAAAETPLTKELAAQLLAACMINNVAPTVEEAINEVDRVARTATADALGPLRSAVASLTEQVAAVRALAESASLGSGTAAVEKAIAEEAYAEALELVSVVRCGEG